MKQIKVEPGMTRQLRSQKKVVTRQDTTPNYLVTCSPPKDSRVQLGNEADTEMTTSSESPPLKEAVNGHTSESSPSAVSVKSLWNSFRYDTTLHGLKYASEILQYRIRGCFQLGLLLLSSKKLFPNFEKINSSDDIQVPCRNKSDYQASVDLGDLQSTSRVTKGNNTQIQMLKAPIESTKTLQAYISTKCLWLIALLSMCSFLIYACGDLFHKYTQRTTTSSINLELVSKLTFPSLTLCNLSPYKKSALNPDESMQEYLLSISRMGYSVPLINYDDSSKSNLSLPLPKGWIYNVSFTVNDLFAVCVDIEGYRVDCDVVLTPKLTDIGLCYTFNSKEYIKINGPMITRMTGSKTSLALYVRIDQEEYVYNDNLAAGMKVIIHDPDEEPDTNTGFFASPGFTSYASLRLTKYKYQPYPFKSTGGRYCVQTKAADFKNPLVYHDTYSRTACMRECEYHYLVSQCGCQAPTDIGNEVLCTFRQIAECYYFNKENYMDNKTIQDACQCSLPCEYNVYSASVSTAFFPCSMYENLLKSLLGPAILRTDYLELRVFFDTLSYLKVEYRPEYDIGEIIGYLGGHMGICLGASLLTLSELTEFLLMAGIAVCKRITQRRQQ